MKCPYCHEEFNSSVGFKAHKNNCLHQDDPLPEPEEEKELEDKNVPELKDIAKEEEITGYSSMKKDELIKAIKEAREE